MAIQWRLYDCSILLSALRGLSTRTIQGVLREYLRRGAHPFFLAQGVRFSYACHTDPRATVEVWKEIQEEADQILKEAYQKYPPVPEVLEGGFKRGVSRLYDREGKPRRGLDEGIIHGVILETFADRREAVVEVDDLLEEWVIESGEILERFLEHPDATIGTLDNLLDLSLPTLDAIDLLAAPVTPPRPPIYELIHHFFVRRLEALDVETVTAELLSVWSPTYTLRFWTLVNYFGSALRETHLCTHLPFTRLLSTVIDAPPKDARRQSVRGRFLNAYPLDQSARLSKEEQLDVLLAFHALLNLVEWVKEELPRIETYHVLIRWLQILTSARARKRLILLLTITKKKEEERFAVAVDERTEQLIEELLGLKVWEALCRLVDRESWKDYIPTESVFQPTLFSELAETLPDYPLFERAVEKVNLTRHDWRLAEEFDRRVYSSRVAFENTEFILEEELNLLSGDIILTVTHLRDEWMPVRRRKEEFLGAILTRIDVARRRDIGDVGAACCFRTYLPEIPQPIQGKLDAEGEMTLENILVLTPPARMALNAAVAQTLVEILIPRYEATLPPKPQTGFQELSYTGEIWTTRPVIHTEGDLSDESTTPELPSGGTRINPTISKIVFQWLTDEVLDNPVRLFQERMERSGGRSEIYYVTAQDAKEQLQARLLSLSEVYVRTVRAHSRPLGVNKDLDGMIKVQQMSNKARRNYERFRQEGGRELSFAPVRKTYILPDGRRMIFDVPKTFNQGTFHTLAEVYEMIPIPTLKQKARELFRLS